MPWGVGGGISSDHPYTNTHKENNSLSFNVNFTWYDSPYVPISLEITRGKLSGGDITSITDHSREYVNKYTAIMLRADLQAGEIIDYYGGELSNVLKNFYVGTGIGVVKNDVDNNHFDLFSEGHPAGEYKFYFNNSLTNIAIPVRVGYEFKFYNEYNEPYIRLDIEYQHSVVFGEGLDGYNDPPSKFRNDYPDQFRQITVGLKYNFGLIRAYTKRIRGVYY